MKQTIIKAACEAGKIIKTGYNKTQKPSYKKGNIRSVVTKIDTMAEKKIIKIIKKKFPNHGFIGEEYGNHGRKSDYTWIIDPLDGTGNFAQKIPFFCVSIALEYKGQTILGVVYNPILEEFYFAEKGKGSYLNEKKVYVSNTKTLKESIGCFGWEHQIKGIKAGIESLSNLGTKIKKIRIFGSAALSLSYLASGKLDFFLIYGINIWDIAAGNLLVKEAGGKVNVEKFGDKLKVVASGKYLNLKL